MDFKTRNGRIAFNGNHFDFYLNENNCDCGECEYCNNNRILCSVKVINGKVTDIDSGETFEEIIYNYFLEVGYCMEEDEHVMFRDYRKNFKVFEQFVIDNHKPTGKFTKPARY